MKAFQNGTAFFFAGPPQGRTFSLNCLHGDKATPFYTRLAMVLASLIALFYIAVLGKSILAPLVFGLLFAVLLLPLANFLERKTRLPRSLASLLSVIILIVVLAGVLYIVGEQVSSLADDWPQFKQQVLGSVNDLQVWISHKFHIRIKQQMTYVNNATSKLLESSGSVLSDVFVCFLFLCAFPGRRILFDEFLFALVLPPPDHRTRFLVSVFRDENSNVVYAIIAQIQSRIRQYILGLLLEMVIVATASSPRALDTPVSIIGSC